MSEECAFFILISYRELFIYFLHTDMQVGLQQLKYRL